jgi:hypothetical protein
VDALCSRACAPARERLDRDEQRAPVNQPCHVERVVSRATCVARRKYGSEDIGSRAACNFGAEVGLAAHISKGQGRCIARLLAHGTLSPTPQIQSLSPNVSVAPLLSVSRSRAYCVLANCWASDGLT